MIRRSGFKDKNWSPFLANGSILWSYTISPHIICENDIDLREHVEGYTLDCVLCVKKFATDTSAILVKQQVRLSALGCLDPVFHLNGVPAHKLNGESFYLGVMHAICKLPSVFDLRGTEEWRRAYVHFFYKMDASSPYTILDVSSPIELSRGRGVGPWLGPEEKVLVAFVTGFQYEVGSRAELLISYGDSDIYSRFKTMTVRNALGLFDEPNHVSAAT